MSSFRRNPGLEQELAAEIRESGALLPVAHDVARRADALAHSAMPRKGRRRMEVSEIGGAVAVVNTNHGGHLEEFGLAHTPVYAPLRRGVLAAGLELREP